MPHNHTQSGGVALLSEETAAAYLGVAPETLKVWRSKSRRAGVLIGPRWVAMGGTGRARLIRYRQVDLVAFVEAAAVAFEPKRKVGRPRAAGVAL